MNLDNCVSRKYTLLAGQGVVLRGTLVGKATVGGVGTLTETHAGNTGNGVFTPDASTPELVNAKVGVYTVTFTSATHFRVNAPDGTELGEGDTGVAFANQIKFTIAAGGTAFVAGDKFLVTAAAGSGKYLVSTAAAVDGSQVPDAIVAVDADSTAGDVDLLVYTRGQFNDAAVIYGAGQSAASVRDVLRTKGIDLIKVVPA